MAGSAFLTDTHATRRGCAAGLLAAGLLASGASLSAHDMWIEPTTFVPAVGELVGARLRVGEHLLGDPLPRRTPLIRDFLVEDSKGRRPLVGRDGADPAGLLRVAEPGLMIIGYHSHPSLVDMTADKFSTYLAEEGLEAIAALRSSRGQTGGARDLFSRSAKSLLVAGAPRRANGDRALGFTIELVAEQNPYTMTAGQTLPVRLTYQGRPLPGALVVGINASDPSARLSARSDADGRVRFKLPRTGMWLIKAVHMIPSTQESRADWESYWASLTFELPGSSDATVPTSR